MTEAGRILEGRERDLAIRAFIGWRIGQAMLPRKPQPELLIEQFVKRRRNCRPRRKWK